MRSGFWRFLSMIAKLPVLEGKCDTVTMKLSAIMEKLPDYFIRCHQSYVVNIDKIVRLEKNQIMLENGNFITISRNRLQLAKNTIQKYFNE